MGSAALMPSSMANYFTSPMNPNSAGILPVQVYQPVGLPTTQAAAVAAIGQGGASAAQNSLVFYQTGYHHSQAQLISHLAPWHQAAPLSTQSALLPVPTAASQLLWH